MSPTLRYHDVKLVARIWVKGLGSPFHATPVYTSSIQGIYTYFEYYLTQTNVTVSHSIFAQKFSPAMQRYQRLAELPTFGHSENHAGLQICDLVCSCCGLKIEDNRLSEVFTVLTSETGNHACRLAGRCACCADLSRAICLPPWTCPPGSERPQ